MGARAEFLPPPLTPIFSVTIFQDTVVYSKHMVQVLFPKISDTNMYIYMKRPKPNNPHKQIISNHTEEPKSPAHF